MTKKLSKTEFSNQKNDNKITSIKKLKKKGMYQVTINDEDYEVSEDLIVKDIIIKDKILTNEELEKLLLEIDNEKYLQKVYHYISFQMRSEYEIRCYLIDLNCPNDLIDGFIEKLKNQMFIDDSVLSRYILNSCINNLKGPMIYKKKLYDRKINISFEYSENDENECIDNLINKLKLRKTKYPVQKQKRLLSDKLLRDGFSERLIYKKLNNIVFQDDSDETLEKEIIKQYHRLENKEMSLYDKKKKIIQNLLSKGYSYANINKTFEKIQIE